MDFDHVRGAKVSGIANMWSWHPDRVRTELAKCELVCANCHRIRTVRRRPEESGAGEPELDVFGLFGSAQG